MIIARAPVRICFGGGSRLEGFYRRYGGIILSAAIDKYFYAILSSTDRNRTIQILTSDQQDFYRVPDPTYRISTLNDELCQAVLRHFGLDRGFNLFLTSELPQCSGLGSASAMVVSLTQAVSSLRGAPVSAEGIAQLVTGIGQDKPGALHSRQDPYSAALGGIRAISFQDDRVTMKRVQLRHTTIRQLRRNLLLFYVPSEGEAEIPPDPVEWEETGEKLTGAFHAMNMLVQEARICLEAGDLSTFGEFLHLLWEMQKQLSPECFTPRVDRCYRLAREHGAIGGTVTHASDGSFMVLQCPPALQAKVNSLLTAEGLVQLDFQFDFQGAAVLMNTLSLSAVEAVGALQTTWGATG